LSSRSSTSFANPAAAVARAFSDTFAGIRPADVPAFVVAELAGAIIALCVKRWLLREVVAREGLEPNSY